MIGSFRLLTRLWQAFGPAWLTYRLWYALTLRSGLMRHRIPARKWPDLDLSKIITNSSLAGPESYLLYRREKAPRFFFTSEDRMKYGAIFPRWDQSGVLPSAFAAELQKGNITYFNSKTINVSFPPDWHLNPITNQTITPTKHWSQISDFENGDIKIIWETNRFTFIYDLVRSYWRTGDEQNAELFWSAIEDWYEKNPPQLGPNWKCGQETSFRVMAWCFALYGFLASPNTTPSRMVMLAQMIMLSGERIEKNIGYALSQRNNHGISEGMGLWTIGTLFPEFKSASRWKEIGRHALENQGRELIYDDGSFSQHSANYHRLMLHDYLWCLRLGDVTGNPLSNELQTRVIGAGEFLYQLQIGEAGQIPNFGQNDGSLILPLSNCEFTDYRPIIHAIYILGYGKRLYDPGPWDEDLLWLFGPEALNFPREHKEKTDTSATDGGYYSLNSFESFSLIRCPKFHDRPSHADALHLDLWWRGQNIAIDPGTYSYNAPEPWNNPLAGTTYHNTVSVDSCEQMDRSGKFLWLPWLECMVSTKSKSELGNLAYLQVEHNGFHRLRFPVRYQRGILQLGYNTWLVLDKLTSVSQHHYRLHWLFARNKYEWDGDVGALVLHTPKGDYFVHAGVSSGMAKYSLVEGDQKSPRGWTTPSYFSRSPALSIAATTDGVDVCFLTLLSPDQCEININLDSVEIQSPIMQASISLLPESSESIVGIAKLNMGTVSESLAVQL